MLLWGEGCFGGCRCVGTFAPPCRKKVSAVVGRAGKRRLVSCKAIVPSTTQKPLDMPKNQEISGTDMVSVTCYGQTRTMTRKEAIDRYLEAMQFSEGSERDRYCTIYFQLLDGEIECSDTE